MQGSGFRIWVAVQFEIKVAGQIGQSLLWAFIRHHQICKPLHSAECGVAFSALGMYFLSGPRSQD
jgi:hypothetical protein